MKPKNMLRKSHRPQRIIAALGVCLLASLTGCAEVQPWERGNLAKPQMQLESQASHRTLLDHVHASREGSAVGSSAQGGGCGCY